MERWIGKTAVVIGASRGIGAAITLALANEGMTVVAASRTLDKLQELQKKVAGKGRVLSFKCDVSKEDEINALMDFSKKQAGGIDVLVNNAAVYYAGTLTDCNGSGLPMNKIEESIQINVTSLIYATRLAARDMMDRKVPGHIIAINSIAGHKYVSVGCLQTSGAYPATKYAVTALSELLRLEFNYTSAPIRMTSISPGLVDTQMIASVTCLDNKLPMLNPEDIASAVVYAISQPQHVNITELTIQVTGETL